MSHASLTPDQQSLPLIPRSAGWRVAALAVLASALLVVGGCTSANDEAEDDSDEPTAASSASPTGATPVATSTETASGTPTGEPSATGTTTTTGTPGATASPDSSLAAPTTLPAPGSVRAVTAYGGVMFRRLVDVAAYDLGGFDLIVAEQGGQLVGLSASGGEEVLDLSARMRGAGNEEGLLSVAIDPAFASNRHVWVYYSDLTEQRQTVVSRFTASADGSIDADTELVVLELPQPYQNHNGGALRFGPDGMLYLGIGDGGSGGDPQGNGQNRSTLLGTVIRISVAGASEVEPYAIPDDNPFAGVPGVRDEIWAYGFRNPWRMSFDPATGNLWLGDVGQERREEVDRVRRGGNHGWNTVEGDLCFGADSCDRAGLVAPVTVYARDDGRCAVTGGTVARNATASNVEGYYLFGDYCSGDLWAIPGDTAPGNTAGGAEAVRIASGLGNIASINQVGAEIYLATFDSPLLRLTNDPLTNE